MEQGDFLFIDPSLDIFSTILSIVLFVAVIPILYAKETLSESKIQMAKIKGHIKKVREVIKEVDNSDDKL